jgi:adenosine kinase
MALLGERPTVVATAGNDFAEYHQELAAEGVEVGEIVVHDDIVTASCFITTDKADNQIIGFFIGAMAKAREISLAEVAARSGSPAVAVVAPDDPEAMARHCREAKQTGVPLVFDPSFQVIAMDGDTLREAADGAYAVILNDYEYAVLQEKTKLSEKELRELAELWVVTYGEKGSDIVRSNGERIAVPACPVAELADPTGAGDAFRGGFVTGLLRGAELAVCGRMGAVAAAYCIEQYGTQSHRYDLDEFWARYDQAYA